MESIIILLTIAAIFFKDVRIFLMDIFQSFVFLFVKLGIDYNIAKIIVIVIIIVLLCEIFG